MSLGGVPVGVCIARFDPVCGNTTTGDPHVSCNIVSVDFNERINEVAAIDIAGGIPGKKCFYLELDNEQLAPEIVFNSCTGLDPVLNQMTGRMNYTPIGALNQGILLQRFKSTTGCLCECTEGTCDNRIAATIWRRFYCFGEDQIAHPGGRYLIEHYPALGYVKTAQTTTSSASADDGEQFTFYAYSNPGFAGPAGVQIPVEAAVNNYNACWYAWTTDDCPPQQGGCSCANCGSANSPLLVP